MATIRISETTCSPLHLAGDSLHIIDGSHRDIPINIIAGDNARIILIDVRGTITVGVNSIVVRHNHMCDVSPTALLCLCGKCT